MENFDFIFDLKSYQFIDENSGFILHAEDVMMEENETVIALIHAGTGVRVDDFFIEVLRDTIESCTPTFPFGN